MKTSLAPQRVQSWSLFGMKPMHRALLRRTAEQVVSTSKESAASPFEITWAVFDSNDPTHHSFSISLSRPGLLIIDSEELVRRIRNHQVSESSLDLLYQRSNAQIRLLWNWCKRGKEDLMWCTELSFDGVICDLASMNRWIRVCLKQGKIIEGQPNTLLRDLQLPKIAQHPFSPV